MPVAERLKHTQVREVVLGRIRSGDYRPGQRLPSERELAEDLDLSHLTIRRALKDLVDAGLIVRRPRVGTFVQETRAMEMANRVALVVPEYFGDPEQHHPFMPVLSRGILAGVNQREYSLSLLSYHYSQFWHDAGEAMLARGIVGAVVWVDSQIPRDQIQKLADSGIKIVMLNTTGLWPELGLSRVSIDLTPCMREAIHHLVADLGHRNLLWLAYDQTRYRDLEEQLTAEYARQYNLEHSEKIIHRFSSEPLSYAGLAALLSDPAERPTAMIIQDEFMAHEVFRVCHQLGLSIPGDLSLVAIADSAPRSHLVPLSAPDTIGLWTAASRRASEHLRHMIESDDAKLIEISLQAAIQWKASTDKPHPTPERSTS